MSLDVMRKGNSYFQVKLIFINIVERSTIMYKVVQIWREIV